ncbi:MAG: glucokinase, partial [Chroococcidiopsis sp.]
MTILLAGDIGGTKTILRLVETTEATPKALYEQRYNSRDYPDLAPIVQEFLATSEEKLGKKLLPQKACFAIAGPVVNNTVQLT